MLARAEVITAAPAAAKALSGIARVVDGDSLEIADAAVRLIAGRLVRGDVLGYDRYQRGLATCSAGEIELNREMVRHGWALAYYPARGVKGPIYDAEEADAEAAQRGLWSGAFVPPWEWRRGVR